MAEVTNLTNTSVPEEPGEEEDDDLTLLPLPWLVITLITICFAIATAVGGNVLVLLSYCRDRQLRSVHNLYLLHLAVSDLLIGAVSMPLYLIYTVMYWTWPFGPVVCKIFMVEDFTMCDMSVFVVILVAWDHLAMIRNGARYSIVETKRKAYVKLAACWVFSFLLYSPAIVFWDLVRGWSEIPADDCDVEFYAEVNFTVATEILSSSVPFLLLMLINTLTFVELRRVRKVADHAAGEPEHPGHASQEDHRASTVAHTFSIARLGTLRELSSHAHSIPVHNVVQTHQHANDRVTVTRVSRRSRDRRAGMNLVLLVVTLVICWLPYSVTTMMVAECESCVNEYLYEFFNWLLWIKSCVNPFLYAYNSPRFRKNFLELLSPVIPARWRVVRTVRGRTITTVLSHDG
ncbi:hypothetical protein BaRGS_00020965 [Batillaria attramentaria]|uniref:G-protein coupled receptors family 1 profile domain-containing protein n=1 Tax=Batillaria attramentaria TaxID=370345 RepID=A0ABD0KKX1_9CAEN